MTATECPRAEIPSDLIPSAEAAELTDFATAWGFVRWARSLGLREFERLPSGRLFWSRAEIMARCFREKDAPPGE
jgi:hypothetical protein